MFTEHCSAYQNAKLSAHQTVYTDTVRSTKKYHFKIFNVALVLDIFCRYIVHDIQIRT